MPSFNITHDQSQTIIDLLIIHQERLIHIVDHCADIVTADPTFDVILYMKGIVESASNLGYLECLFTRISNESDGMVLVNISEPHRVLVHDTIQINEFNVEENTPLMDLLNIFK